MRTTGSASGGVVLLYHRVTTLETDPQLLAVSPDHFAQQLEVIRRIARPMSLEGMMSAAAERELFPGSVALTFDDGYADNLHEAAPLLQRYEVPATVFATSAHTGTTEEFFWDELDRLLLQPGEVPGELNLCVGADCHHSDFSGCGTYTRRQWEADRSWDVTQAALPGSRQQAYMELCGLLHRMRADARTAAIAQLRQWAGPRGAGRATHRMMTSAELRQLCEGGLIDVGGHTVLHPLLSVETASRQRAEILGNCGDLNAMLDRRVTAFSYPFGGRRDYTPDSVAAVREAGYQVACSNFRGQVTESTDPLQIPRFLVRNWDGERFEAELRAWLAAPAAVQPQRPPIEMAA